MNDGNPRRNQGAARHREDELLEVLGRGPRRHEPGRALAKQGAASHARDQTRPTILPGGIGKLARRPDLHVPHPDSRPLQGEHVRREPRILGGQVGVEPERYARRSAAHHGPAPAGSEVVRGRLLESRRLEAGPRRHRHSRQVGQAPDIARPEPGVPEDPSIEGDVSRGVVEKPAKPRDGDPLQLVGGPPLALAQLSQARAHPPTARPVEQREDSRCTSQP